jgi:hypothetical protein
MNIDFNVEVLLIYITKPMNPNYNIISCFLEKNPQKTLKICVISKQICGFIAKVPTAPPTLI